MGHRDSIHWPLCYSYHLRLRILTKGEHVYTNLIIVIGFSAPARNASNVSEWMDRKGCREGRIKSCIITWRCGFDISFSSRVSVVDSFEWLWLRQPEEFLSLSNICSSRSFAQIAREKERGKMISTSEYQIYSRMNRFHSALYKCCRIVTESPTQATPSFAAFHTSAGYLFGRCRGEHIQLERHFLSDLQIWERETERKRERDREKERERERVRERRKRSRRERRGHHKGWMMCLL